MKKLLIPVLFIILITSGLSREKRPLSFEDFYGFQRVSDPQPSPDGNWIAYTVTKVDVASNSSNKDIYVISSDGKNLKQLTSSAKSESQPRWSPDGKYIAFVSNKDGGSQIYIMPMAGGEARKLTTISTGASGPVWSADGSKILFTSTVYPDCESDDCNATKLKSRDENPVKAQIWDGLLFKHWNRWTHGMRNHVFIADVADGKFHDLTPGDFDSPPIDLGGSPDYAISPDGKEVCFVKNPDDVVAVSTNNDLFIVPATGGAAKQITTNKGNDANPVYSPDGKYIAYTAMARAGFEADRKVIMLYDRINSQTTAVTSKLDRSATDLVWDKNSRSIYFLADDLGYNSVYRVEIKNGKTSRITKGSYNKSLSLTTDGRLVFIREAINKPADVWLLDEKRTSAKQLTFHNKAALAQLEMNPLEEFWFEGAASTKVHGLMVKPPKFDASKKYPLIYLVHGGPQGAWHDNFHYRWNAQMFAASGYVVVMVNPRGSTGYGQKFTDEISQDWGGKVYEDLKRGWEFVGSNYPFIDADRMGAAGASYGGYMMYWLEGRENPFKCLVSHDGVFNLVSMYGTTEELWFPEWEMAGAPWESPALYQKWSPSSYVENFKTPMLIVHSQKDFRVDVGQGFEAFTALQKMGVPSKFLYFPDEDHFVSKPQNARLWWKTLQDWFDGYLK
ncbi:MAG: S9 family peptidase [Calditrichaeota bacterium]|nr:MAG: S9 family peptidase [Calditrichota bacterium]